MSQSCVCVFPGQGSQSVGMLSAWGQQALVRETFEEASAALGYDVWGLSQEGPQALLDQTDRTQPAILTASIALWRVWCAEGLPMPAYVAGHSLGEYSALVAAESLSLADAVRLVERRGQLMQAAVPLGAGGMAAILGLGSEAIADCCATAAQSEVVAPANFNAPDQTVIAGTQSAVRRAMAACLDAGAKRALELPVSVPSHSELMRPAADAFAEALAAVDLRVPRIAVVQNVLGCVAMDLQHVNAALLSQLYSPVRWTDSMAWLDEQGVRQLVECGPGKVLCGLAKRCVKSWTAQSLEGGPEQLELVHKALTENLQ